MQLNIGDMWQIDRIFFTVQFNYYVLCDWTFIFNIKNEFYIYDVLY